jgi:hypothetical protein
MCLYFSYTGGTRRRITAQDWPRQKYKTLPQKITEKQKQAGSVAEVME